MKKQYLTQVIIGEHSTTAAPMWSGYGTYAHKIPITSNQTHLYQRISVSSYSYLSSGLSDDLKQYMNGLTGIAQPTKRRKW